MPTVTKTKSYLDILQILVYRKYLAATIILDHWNENNEFLRISQQFKTESELDKWLHKFNRELIQEHE
jgi:hypothetical protein